MGRSEQITSPTPPGAGRIRDLNWPDYTTAGTNSQPTLRCRTSGASFGGVLTNFGAGASTIWNFANGMDAYSITSQAGGGTGCCYSWFNNVNVNVRTSPLTYWPPDDDWNVHRIVWIAAINGPITTDNDMGPEFNSGNASTAGIVKDNSVGFGWRFATGGKANFITRSTALGTTEITVGQNGVGGFQCTDFHSYELRIFSALPNVPAFLKLIVDDVLVQTIPWSSGKLPANGEQAANICGFYPVLFCNSANTTSLITKLLSFQAAPSELATL